MWHMRIQLRRLFMCTDKQLDSREIISAFYDWLEQNPDINPNLDPLYANPVNVDIAKTFYEFYTREIKNHEMV